MLEEATRREQIDQSLLRRIHEDGDLIARDEMARRCLPLVRSIARKYAGRGEPMDDLVQAGTVGLVKAIDRFDLGAGHRFVSFAVPNITGEIRRHFRDHTWAVHVPRSLQELDAKVQDARGTITAQTGREATDDDVASALGLTLAEVRQATDVGRAYRARSLDAPSGEDRVAGDVHGVPERGYAQVEASVVVEGAMDVLKPRDRDVLRMRYDDGLLQREIAERIGVSQMQVSRIISGAIERMGDHVRGHDAPPLAA